MEKFHEVDSSDFAFKQLRVWQRAVDFADHVIGLVERIETQRKHYRLLEQIEAASTSVAMNIAEGKGRHSKKEYKQFLYYSRDSLYETITLMCILHKRKWINDNQLEAVNRDGVTIAKMLNKLIGSIRV